MNDKEAAKLDFLERNRSTRPDGDGFIKMLEDMAGIAFEAGYAAAEQSPDQRLADLLKVSEDLNAHQIRIVIEEMIATGDTASFIISQQGQPDPATKESTATWQGVDADEFQREMRETAERPDVGGGE